MMRMITILVATLVLSGCVSREVVYRDRYVQAPHYEGGYSSDSTYYRDDGGYYQDDSGYYRDGGSYYGSSTSGYGSYYSGAGYGPSYSSNISFGVNYFDYPVYYSMFWPINRWYYDPFAYPGYHYGVTWFPRSYLSLSMSFGNRWGSSGYLHYSPYRYSWVDNYYDWSPWYNRYPNYQTYYPTPRYGDARVEASRLVAQRRASPQRAQTNSGYYDRSSPMRNTGVAPASRGNRAADYGGRTNAASRQSTSRDGVRRVNSGAPRSTPDRGLFGNPSRDASSGSRMDSTRGQPLGSRMNNNDIRSDGRTDIRTDNRNELGRVSGQRTPVPVHGSAADANRAAAQLGTRGAVQSRQSTGDQRIPDTRTTRPVQRTQSSGIALPTRSAQPVRSGTTITPVQTRSPIQTRSISTPRPATREAMPVRQTSPAGQVMPRQSMGSPASRAQPSRPAPAAPTRNAIQQVRPATGSGPVYRAAPPTSAPVRSAPAPARSEPAAAPAPASRPAPPEPSRSERSSSPQRTSSSSQRRDSGVRRVGSQRER